MVQHPFVTNSRGVLFSAMQTDPAFLRDIPMFSRLDEEELRVLAAASTQMSLAPNQVLFREGEPGDAMYVVQNGVVELFVEDLTGQKILLHAAQVSDFFGELSLFDMGPRTATAQAASSCELIVLDRKDLVELFEKKPDAALHMLATLGAMTRKADALLRKRVVRNVNEEVSINTTLIQKIADVIAEFSGSMMFLFANAIWFLCWIGWNTLQKGFDPYPFGLLTMIVSLEAIFLSCFVLISQNRQTAKDRVRSDIEYETNMRAELEIAHLHEKTDRFHADALDRLQRLEKAFTAAAKPRNP